MIAVMGPPSQEEATYQLVSHCESYQYSRPLWDILAEGDAAFVIQQVGGQDLSQLVQARFEVLKTFFGEARDEMTFLSFTTPTDGVHVEERYALHSRAAFFWSYASLPLAYGYLGENPNDCTMIPVIMPGQRYIVVLQNERIMMFEPVPRGEYLLIDFLDYYANECCRAVLEINNF